MNYELSRRGANIVTAGLIGFTAVLGGVTGYCEGQRSFEQSFADVYEAAGLEAKAEMFQQQADSNEELRNLTLISTLAFSGASMLMPKRQDDHIIKEAIDS